jgi:hypothetical protein
MVNPRGLIGVGMPAQLAKRLGTPSSALESNLNGGAAFSSAAAIGQFQFYVRANAQTGANIYQMPANGEIGSEFCVYNFGGISSGVTCNLYPPIGGTFNIPGGATATLTAVATGKAIFLIAVTASTYDAFLSA